MSSSPTFTDSVGSYTAGRAAGSVAHGGTRSVAPLDGTLAESMERVARLAASALGAPAVLFSLVGDDRRCFGGGRAVPAWLSHDPGVLVRSGLLARVLELGEAMAVEDARHESQGKLGAAMVELEIAAYIAVPLIGSDGGPLGLCCVVHDAPRAWTDAEVTVVIEYAATAATEVALRRQLADRERVERLLRHDALHDPLTGLPNRTLFMERLGYAVERMGREPHDRFAVVFLDLDNFKVVNDSVGHHAGDELLALVARRLESCVRGGDLVARLGGDEFALLLERVADARDVARIAERIQEVLAAPISLGGFEHFTSASIGIALSAGRHERPEYLLRSADMAMYRAKNGGRARYELFDPAMHAEALRRLQMESEMRRALERGEFALHYQPVVTLESGRVEGVEALVRWHHPTRGIIPPSEFVAVAEETGLIVALGHWVIAEACRQARQWEVAGLGTNGGALTVSVNLSAKQLAQQDLAPFVEAALRKSRLSPAALKLEITESAVIERADLAADTLRQLCALGVQIYMDDFGTGYSSLSYLHRLPLHAIKVDREFVDTIDDDERALQLVRTIVTLVRNLGLVSVAEGVRTEEQLRRLRELGCTYAQGYLFSEPLDAAGVETLLAEEPRW